MAPPLVKSVKNIFPTKKCPELLHDCAIIFNCKSLSGKSDYSAGHTYFIKACDKPRTALEELAQKIFLFHAQDVADYDPEHSGAEWWSQVIHPEDDIGVHWDRDYGLEEDMGQHVYPYVGTVTYLSNIGAPTVVFDKKGTDLAIEEIIGSIDTMVVSCPSIGNHIAFDGTMLHAAPADIFKEDESSDEDEDDQSEESEAPTLNELLETVDQKRVTFLVNIWINHIPSQSRRCDKKVIKQLTAPLLKDNIQFRDPVVELHSNRLDAKLGRSMTLSFNNTDTNYDLVVPLPEVTFLENLRSSSSVFKLSYRDDEQIQLSYAEDQPSEDESMSNEDEDDNENDDDDEEEEEEEEVEVEKVEVKSIKVDPKRQPKPIQTANKDGKRSLSSNNNSEKRQKK